MFHQYVNITKNVTYGMLSINYCTYAPLIPEFKPSFTYKQVSFPYLCGKYFTYLVTDILKNHSQKPEEHDGAHTASLKFLHTSYAAAFDNIFAQRADINFHNPAAGGSFPGLKERQFSGYVYEKSKGVRGARTRIAS